MTLSSAGVALPGGSVAYPTPHQTPLHAVGRPSYGFCGLPVVYNTLFQNVA